MRRKKERDPDPFALENLSNRQKDSLELVEAIQAAINASTNKEKVEAGNYLRSFLLAACQPEDY